MKKRDKTLRKEARAALPAYFKKLCGPYEYRVFYFEIFECVRKVSLIGLPVFFAPGTMEQCVIGLFVCFVSFGMYMAWSPFYERRHDLVAMLCQLQIFLTLLVAVLLKGDPTERRMQSLDAVLVAIGTIPPACCAILISPAGNYILDEQRRAKALKLLSTAFRSLSRRWRRTATRPRTSQLPAPTELPAPRRLKHRQTL